jgi:hypothetical protein
MRRSCRRHWRRRQRHRRQHHRRQQQPLFDHIFIFTDTATALLLHFFTSPLFTIADDTPNSFSTNANCSASCCVMPPCNQAEMACHPLITWLSSQHFRQRANAKGLRHHEGGTTIINRRHVALNGYQHVIHTSPHQRQLVQCRGLARVSSKPMRSSDVPQWHYSNTSLVPMTPTTCEQWPPATAPPLPADRLEAPPAHAQWPPAFAATVSTPRRINQSIMMHWHHPRCHAPDTYWNRS